jgi:hypothetical protein
MEGSGRDLIQSTIAAFGWRDWGKHENIRIAGLRHDIWTRDLPNTKQEWEPLCFN